MTVEAKQGGSLGCFAHIGEDDEPVVGIIATKERDALPVEVTMENALLFGRALIQAAEDLKIPRKRWDLDQQIMGSGEE